MCAIIARTNGNTIYFLCAFLRYWSIVLYGQLNHSMVLMTNCLLLVIDKLMNKLITVLFTFYLIFDMAEIYIYKYVQLVVFRKIKIKLKKSIMKTY